MATTMPDVPQVAGPQTLVSFTSADVAEEALARLASGIP
jgi:hypothetical protein